MFEISAVEGGWTKEPRKQLHNTQGWFSAGLNNLDTQYKTTLINSVSFYLV
jgi:hypothetical protein